ncbi:MAG: serine/threonine protein kinase, partial [Gemmatimonadales bacterium]
MLQRRVPLRLGGPDRQGLVLPGRGHRAWIRAQGLDRARSRPRVASRRASLSSPAVAGVKGGAIAVPTPIPVSHQVSPEFLRLQTEVAGRYSLERELGRGGMGIVLLARDVALDRLVAIKLLPPELAAQSELRERFLREARTAAGLSHPHIVPIHAVEEHNDLVFFVMGLVDGQTLRERVEQHGPLSPRATMQLVQEVAWALGYAHSRGIVHRDIKPENIMLERATGRSMVTDFGIASVAALDEPGPSSTISGTARYMSPEQAVGEAVDARSDLYSLGVTAFFALTGRTPFEAPTSHALVAQHLTAPPPSVSTL